jgi:hypothetical protein
MLSLRVCCLSIEPAAPAPIPPNIPPIAAPPIVPAAPPFEPVPASIKPLTPKPCDPIKYLSASGSPKAISLPAFITGSTVFLATPAAKAPP